MKFSTACLATLALLFSEVHSSDVKISSDRAPLAVDHQLRVIQLKLDELFVEGSEQVEQLRTELYHLRQSVQHVAWLTSRVERAVQKVQLDNDVLVRNVTLLTSQTDNIILNQQYCANHEALKNLFFDLTPKCLGNQTVQPPSIPSSTTTSAVTEASTTSSETTTITIPETTEAINVYERCSRAPLRSGVYRLRRRDGAVFEAFCEQERFGGGLLVFQSRLDGSVDFNRSWSEFVAGFGDPAGEFWLGLETLHQVAPNATELVIDMKNFSNFEAYEKYSDFWVDSYSFNYRIRFRTKGTGTAGDSLFYYYNESFVTYDRYFSNSFLLGCVNSLASGFWHYSCTTSRERNNLNGIYGLGRGRKGIWWGTFGNLTFQNTSPLKTVQMMVRY